jgi:ketosteroid isomerase-like protein
MKALLAGLALLVVLGLGFFLYSSPSAPTQMTEAEIAQIEAEVMAFAEDHLATFEALDADRLTGYWVEGNITSVSFAERIVGPEEMAAFYENLVGGWATNDGEWLPGSVVDVISTDMALFQGTARQETTTPEGGSRLMNLHFTHFLKKIDGTWKIQRNHVSGGVVTDG